MKTVPSLADNLQTFWGYTGFYNAEPGHIIMILIGLVFIYLAISKEYEPLLLIPIGFGILVGNIPFNETRDYVKKVLSNTADYAGLFTGQPQSLKRRLGTVGPLAPGEPDMSRDLP